MRCVRAHRLTRLSITLATVPVALLTACSAGSTGTTADTSSSAASPSTEASAGPGGVDIGGRNIYLDCRGTSENDSPTVILVSGYHDSSDVWNQTDVLSLIGTAKGPPVQEALAQGHRVCSYDRPGTLRYIEGLPLTDRSTPVSQPRDAADLVSELNATLAAAGIPEPYVLVGHSSAV